MLALRLQSTGSMTNASQSPSRRSLVVYRGPSRYDPETNIRAVLVLKSTNVKTGDMAQLFVLNDTVPPHIAQKQGCDFAVCGNCPLRPANQGGCYVTTFQGPLSTWRSTMSRPVAGTGEIAGALQGRALRLGAYGDVAALPPDVVAWLSAQVGGRVTGYTHGHKVLGLDMVENLRTLCMLSVESEAQALDAQQAGWRTFRSRAEGAPLLAREIECPTERVDCLDCLLCRGASIGAKSISIPVHGFASRRALSVIQNAAA
jgi:hypothetical protein